VEIDRRECSALDLGRMMIVYQSNQQCHAGHYKKGLCANHEFEKARFYSDEERKERENLRLLRGKYKLDETAVATVSREDIENVVARWTGIPVASIRQSRSVDGPKDTGS
jgi:ATP-dependent Clp protease ATP-binding subunit ClpA